MHENDAHENDLTILSIDRACDRFEAAWKAGESPRIEDYMTSEIADHALLLRELLLIEFELVARDEKPVRLEDYQSRFPHHESVVGEAFLAYSRPRDIAHDQSESSLNETLSVSQSFTDVDEHPRQIGRWKILKFLGQGGFGRVFLAHDEVLERKVAIKIPRHAQRQSQVVEQYLMEARIVAGLDHPGIVPVYHADRTEDGQWYIVSKYIEGGNLQERIKTARLSTLQSVQCVAKVADALRYAHRKKLVHRDIKPANVLIDSNDNYYVTDFGAALTEEGRGKSESRVGTYAYMSPEQARGQSDVVDGCSDIFSLGVVLYELLIGERPFNGAKVSDIIDQIMRQDARPLRQLDESIPHELERICLKALAKNRTDRYLTAFDFAEDLRNYLGQANAMHHEGTTAGIRVRHARLRSIPPLLPYLVDRKIHEQQIRKGIQESLSRSEPVPVVCVLHGDEFQCHDTFVQRLQETSLPRFFGLDRDSPAVRRIFVEFARDFEEEQDIHDYFLTRLRDELGIGTDERISSVSRRLNERPSLIYTQVASADFGTKDVWQFEALLRLWSKLPTQPTRHPLVVCMGIKFNFGRGPFSRWRLNRRNRRLRKFLGQLDFEAYRGIVGVVLRELRNPTRSEVEDWAINDAAAFFDRQELLPRLRALYDWEDSLSMEKMAEELRGLIQAELATT
jgi:serine/threonine protein kinase